MPLLLRVYFIHTWQLRRRCWNKPSAVLCFKYAFSPFGGEYEIENKTKTPGQDSKIFLGCAFPYRALKISLTKLHIGPEEQEQHLISAARAAVCRTPHSYRAVQRCGRVEDEERPYTPMPVKLGGEY